MKKLCKSCLGKKYHTQWSGGSSMGDFIGEKPYRFVGESEKKTCSRCNGKGYVDVKLWWTIKAKFINLFKLKLKK